MTNETVKITPLEVGQRPTSLEGWQELYGEAVLCEILNRYHDMQCHARNYRMRAAAKDRMVKELLKGKAAEAGCASVEEYLKKC